MELLDGMDLETLVIRHGRLPPARVCSLLMQACSSLAEAHASGLIHRDIKPANLYVCRVADEVDVLKVLDFGLVRSLADESSAEGHSFEDLARELESNHASLPKLTAAGAVMGTPEFMAPEQILGLDIDARADIYALGCVAYYALAGACPFTGKDALAIMMQHLQNEANPLAARTNGTVPPKLVALVARCMAKQAADRPASVSLLRRELAAIEFSASERWSDEDAADWWDANVPRVVTTPSLGPLSPKSGTAPR